MLVVTRLRPLNTLACFLTCLRQTSEGKQSLQGALKMVRAGTEAFETTMRKWKTAFSHNTVTLCVLYHAIREEPIVSGHSLCL